MDIGIDEEYLYEVHTQADLIGKLEAMSMYRPRNKFSHKGTYGHTVIVGGSYGKIGASLLTSKAALTAGSGLVTAYVPECGYIPFQSSFYEAMLLTDKNDKHLTNISLEFKPTVVAIGPGMGKHPLTVKAFEGFLNVNKSPLVVDADALNILSENMSFLKLLPENSVLTPHAKELERLVGKWKDDFDKLDKAKSFSKKHKAILVLKGANTITVFGDKLYINSTGNPGMATAGSGDVLTGVIAGLIAQGYDSLTAAVFGVYLHGKAGDIGAEIIGHESLMASHMIDCLGDAFLDLFKRPEQQEMEEDENHKEDTN